MKLVNLFLTIAATISLAACSNTYKKENLYKGIEAHQLSDNTYQISYVESDYADFKEANQIIRLRSADLTLQNGYNYFVLNRSFSTKKTTPPVIVLNITMFKDIPEVKNAMVYRAESVCNSAYEKHGVTC